MSYLSLMWWLLSLLTLIFSCLFMCLVNFCFCHCCWSSDMLLGDKCQDRLVFSNLTWSGAVFNVSCTRDFNPPTSPTHPAPGVLLWLWDFYLYCPSVQPFSCATVPMLETHWCGARCEKEGAWVVLFTGLVLGVWECFHPSAWDPAFFPLLPLSVLPAAFSLLPWCPLLSVDCGVFPLLGEKAGIGWNRAEFPSPRRGTTHHVCLSGCTCLLKFGGGCSLSDLSSLIKSEKTLLSFSLPNFSCCKEQVGNF